MTLSSEQPIAKHECPVISLMDVIRALNGAFAKLDTVLK